VILSLFVNFIVRDTIINCGNDSLSAMKLLGACFLLVMRNLCARNCFWGNWHVVYTTWRFYRFSGGIPIRDCKGLLVLGQSSLTIS